MNVPKIVLSLAGLKNCPNEQQLAAYSEQQLMGAERNAVETHLASCDRCLAQVSFLVRSRSQAAEQVPNELIKTAVELGRSADRQEVGRRWLLLGAAATATLVGLVATIVRRQSPNMRTESVQVAQVQPDESKPATVQEKAPAEQRLRGDDATDQEIVISPKRDEKLDSNQIDFRWRGVKGAIYYEIQVVTENGDVVWQERTERTEARPAISTKLEKGRVYYVWVKIHLAQEMSQQSKAVRFTVE